MTAAPTLATASSVESGAWFYAGTAVFAMLFSIAAFGPSMVHTSGRLGPLTGLVAAHGVVFFAWLLIFLSQSVLVRTGRLAFHRRLGALSAILAAAVVLLGCQATVAMARGCTSDLWDEVMRQPSFDRSGVPKNPRSVH
jgi:hypothetical protein